MASVSPSKRHSMSTIESSVTRLLVATKHLLESLTQWAKHNATESDVSDSYVQLGNEFKVACRAFSNAGVDVSDLGDVPGALRSVLEEALCETPSQESLDRFLPAIREIIVTLLQNLKTKQAVARTLRENKSRDNLKVIRSEESFPSRSSSVSKSQKQSYSSTNTPISRRASVESGPSQEMKPRSEARTGKLTDISHTKSKSTNNALAQLQKGDSLQRRASRRFSAYQYAKLTSYSPNRDHELPDHSTIIDQSVRKSSPLSNKTRNIADQQSGDGPATLSVFLKIGDRVKKCELTTPISFTTLRLLFVEKFAYSPGSGTFPDIYIQDEKSSVPYELEEHLFEDLKDGTVISLNVNRNAEILDQLNRNLKELKSLQEKKNAEILKSTKDYIDESNEGILQKLQTVFDTTGINSPSLNDTSKAISPNKDSPKPKRTSQLFTDMSDLLDIRHELSVIKQINSSNTKTFKESIEHVLRKVRDFKSLSLDTSKSSNRTYMEESHAKLSKSSDSLLTKFDDLQDIVEALRKDVAQRGARPSEKQLEFVTKQLSDAQTDLDLMVAYIATEKPNWKQIWESELDTVCQEQQFLTLQEDLAHDLREDLDKATETFNLVRNVCEEQSKNPKIKQTSLPLAEPGSLPNLRDALLSEVEALNPNHENRLEAIAKAEKLREKEKQMALMNGFEEELGGFVDGQKLKKSGGIEEVERVRRMKDEQNLRSAFPPPF